MNEWSVLSILATVIPVAAGIWFFANGFQTLAKKRLVENIPRSSVRSAAAGLVELQGMAATDQRIVSPISNRPCCWWSCEVEEERRGSRGETSWQRVFFRASSERLMIEDETGRILIEPVGAEAYVPGETSTVDAGIGAALGSIGFNRVTFLGVGARMRVTERVIFPNSPLYAMGELSPVPEAWAQAEGCRAGLLLRAPAARPFILSTSPESSLRRELGMKAFGWLALGLGMILGALWIGQTLWPMARLLSR